MDRAGRQPGKRFYHQDDKSWKIMELLHIKDNIKGVNIMTLYQVTSN
jgi:hypothetical protein